MVSAGQGALFSQFHTLLRMIPNANPAVIDYLQRFNCILQKALARAVEGTGAAMDIVADEGAYRHITSSSSADASTYDYNNHELTSSHLLGVSSDSTLAERYSIELHEYEAGGDQSFFT